MQDGALLAMFTLANAEAWTQCTGKASSPWQERLPNAVTIPAACAVIMETGIVRLLQITPSNELEAENRLSFLLDCGSYKRMLLWKAGGMLSSSSLWSC